MNYRLKKDLPFAKAGTIIELSPSEGCIPMAIYDFRDLPGSKVSNVTISKEYLDELISEGWIEEVKPREWYEIEFDNSREWIKAFNTYRYSTLKEAQERLERIVCRDDMPYRIIKVREVIQ